MQNFNPTALAEVIELEETGEEGLVDGIIGDYLANCPELMSSIETAAAEKDYGRLERFVHSFKSSSSLLGLESTAEIALEMEYQAREHQFDPARLEMLRQRLELGQRELESYRISRNRK